MMWGFSHGDHMALFDGTKVNLGGRDFILPPLTLKALRQLGPKIGLLGSLSGMPTEEQIDAMIEVAHASISRNYPEITLDELGDLLDLGNLQDVFPAVMAASGLAKLPEGKAASPVSLIGASSTD